jgi:hypothetical protein
VIYYFEKDKDIHVKFIFPTCSFESCFKGIGQTMEERVKSGFTRSTVKPTIVSSSFNGLTGE